MTETFCCDIIVITVENIEGSLFKYMEGKAIIWENLW